MRVKLADVAALAGVAGRTASRVINQEPNVSDAVRKRVEAAVRQLGYVPDLAARSLAASRSFTLAILFDNPSPHNMVNVQTGALLACGERNYHLMIKTLDHQAPDLPGQVEHALKTMRVEGLILTPRFGDNEAVLDLLESRKLAYVRVASNRFPERSHSICIDDQAAAGDVARHLWSLGHRHFGLVNGPQDHGSAVARRSGFLEALKQCGAGYTVAEQDGHFRFEGGIAAGQQLLSVAQRPTAIFSANDDSAAGVLSAATMLGLRVPDDVSIVGFDDTWIAKSVWPYLTTIHQPIKDMAYAAASLLLDPARMNGPVQTIQLDYDLIIRDSTAVAMDTLAQ